LASKEILLKKQKIRNSEYYDMQAIFDNLYIDSKNDNKFNDLIKIIKLPKNILLAYRNIKKNEGSKTAGIDNKTIKDLGNWKEEALIKHVQNKLNWYNPNKILRVKIPKENGKIRHLGIATIMDRLIQQCILQVLEPICEAKFFKRSNGFRPNRSTENAIAQAERMMQNINLHYVVDIDIKSFFDEISHGKLIKQMWTLGINDKKLICIISRMLKAEVANIGFPEKGASQGNIISPILSNIVLNELDWWIASQWENIPTEHDYVNRVHTNGTPDRSNTYRALRKSSLLKECYIVRYADDAKIFCRNYTDAKRLMVATELWLKDRLGLDINPEKSKIVNLKRHYSKFLGFKLKVRKKGKKADGKTKYVITAHVKDEALKRIKSESKDIIKKISKTYDEKMEYKLIQKYNAFVIGVHNYYCIASNVSLDFSRIAFDVKKILYIRLKHGLKKKGKITNEYIHEKYGTSRQIRYVNGNVIIPLAYIQHRIPMDIKAKINKYTPEGRAEIHKNLTSINMKLLYALMNNPSGKKSIEYNDNRISLFVAQKGKCAITSVILESGDIHCHHKVPTHLSGTDKYNNLIIISSTVHILIHAERDETIKKYIKLLAPDKRKLERINKLRNLANLNEIKL
jgi:RNA-directed DNA polymerase